MIKVRPSSDTTFSHTILRFYDKKDKNSFFLQYFFSLCVNWKYFFGGKDILILKCSNNILTKNYLSIAISFYSNTVGKNCWNDKGLTRISCLCISSKTMRDLLRFNFDLKSSKINQKTIRMLHVAFYWTIIAEAIRPFQLL